MNLSDPNAVGGNADGAAIETGGRRPLAKVPSPDLADRCLRALWWLVWITLYRPTPIPLHGWRRFILRLFGAKVEAGATPYPSARIWAPWNLTMMKGSCLASGSEAYNVAHITLHPDCIVSQGAYLCTASHDLIDPGMALTAGPISIGRNAWVAAHAFIGPGVSLGDCAMAAACAVVTRSVRECAIVAGNPAKVIGTRVDHFKATDQKQ